MLHFFGYPEKLIYAVSTLHPLTENDKSKLEWLFGGFPLLDKEIISHPFVGPRKTMITPWSTNAVEITQTMGIHSIGRIESFEPFDENTDLDPMLYQKYESLNQNLFHIEVKREPIKSIEDIYDFNNSEGLALSEDEVQYLEDLSKRIKRPLTDSEVFGFSQINSEHCRHKIFNGIFEIDGAKKPHSLFQLIKKTSKENPQGIVSAYKDNVAFVEGPEIEIFAPKEAGKPSPFSVKKRESVLSLKAETHNFPTTVEPFNGAATGSGGEIRDRLAGGQGSIPMAGTAVYMTAYPRLENGRLWENNMPSRKWLYQNPLSILIKASNGASDFGNKFGQPLISGSLFTFEYNESKENNVNPSRKLGYDKVIMLAGGIGYAQKKYAQKERPQKGDKIVVMGGDNYRIGMGGAAVSSADTGAFDSGLELNAVQRSNPEMQKRVADAIKALSESDDNPIVLIHDHGAGGHLNCLTELVEEEGGVVEVDKLPIGDKTLSDKEIIGNESQERMGLVVKENDFKALKEIADRERAPIFDVGHITNDKKFVFKGKEGNPMDLSLEDMFGNSPKTLMKDATLNRNYEPLSYNPDEFISYLEQVLQLESVACKDWLTNKVDRCVGGKVAKQQCVGPLQMPLNNCGVMALDFSGVKGIATAIGHAPLPAIIDPVKGSRLSIAESLTNLIWAPLESGLSGVSLSANWMWPCKQEGEDSRLYDAVEATSTFAIELGINIPTGKDSLSMTQKYKDDEVVAPGTVIISAIGNCSHINKVIEPVFQKKKGAIFYIPMTEGDFELGGSAFAQVVNGMGEKTTDVINAQYFKKVFNGVQSLTKNGHLVAGHDISAGGMIGALLEMCFADTNLGAEIDLSAIQEKNSIKLLFSEQPGLLVQAKDLSLTHELDKLGLTYYKIGEVKESDSLSIINQREVYTLTVSKMRDFWFKTSYLLDKNQTANGLAESRFKNYSKFPLKYNFPNHFDGKLPQVKPLNRPRAAIIREKGSNSEKEMANAMYRAGFEVIDVHMTDLISGREDLSSVQFIGAVGGFSNSDVLGSAKGWAGAFKYNDKAQKALQNFFARKNTLSIGICNGCQLFMELELLYPSHANHGKMTHNDSLKHESGFVSVDIQKNNSIMMSHLEGSKLGVWISHGEGKFSLPSNEDKYHIVGKYSNSKYPFNPNGSDYNTAMMCDATGRHLVTMPHIERSYYPWNWAHYPKDRMGDEVSPWAKAFVNAYNWVIENK